ncbi:MAG: carboxypeptidase regulatory-like domain-containing protein, partial [Myxococcales bacterium]|nr:carboxypeptidase regulatory-like domain-containing protein [Myxococcales bacterium]
FAPGGRAHGPGIHPRDVWGALTGPARGTVRIEGRVLDQSSGDPVADIDVVFAGPDGGPGETTATADASGHYAIDVVPGTYRAFVRGDGVISVGNASWDRLPGAADPDAAGAVNDQLAPLLRVAHDQRGVDLGVERAGVIVGRVLDDGGRPVVGAAVRTLGGGGRRPVLGTDVVETDASGGFRLEVPVGYYALDATDADHAGLAQPDGDPPMVEVLAGETSTIDLRMASGCIVTGHAVRRDGRPAGEGAIERGLGGSDFAPAGRLDADGAFRWTTVASGDVTLRAWPWKSPPAPGQTVACHDGARFDLTFEIPDDAPDLAGRIVGADGAPVSVAYVDIYGMSAGTMNQQERGDADGRWAVYALPPGDYAISAHVPGQGVAWTTASVPGPEVVLQLSGTGSVAGEVTGMVDGTLAIEVDGCGVGGGAVGVDRQTVLAPVSGGRYRVDGLPACRLAMTIRTPGRTLQTDVEVPAGGVARADVDVSPPRAKEVHVHVRRVDGSPAAGALVMAFDPDLGGAMQPRAADGDGEITLDAHVGEVVHAFLPDGSQMGQDQVSDAPGDREDITITLEDMSGFIDP